MSEDLKITDKKLVGKTAIITGASRGMGHAMALHLIRDGHELLCIARTPSDALAAAAEQAGIG